MRYYSYIALAMLLLLTGCRNDDIVIYPEKQDTGKKSVEGEIVGMYVLNEGNMGSNKCTIDYLDLSANTATVQYIRNIYPSRNPNTVKELGDVGNDIQVYGSRLWMVINCSNKVEVATIDSCKRIGQVDIPNCRYVTFNDRYAYVSSYVGPVAVSGDAPLGRVYKVDTLSLQKVDSVTVGYQPEEMAVIGNRLYVANSGGYRLPDYDHTVSVINLNTFREERKIEVAVNLHRCKADEKGQLWVTSRGDYYNNPSRIFWLETDEKGDMQLAGCIDTSVSDFCIAGDSLYFYGSAWNNATMKNTKTYGIINASTHQVVSDRLSSSAEAANIRTPYGIVVNPVNRDFYLMDAKNYVSSGELLHFLADGTFDWRVWTGDIPAHAAFIWKMKTK